MGGVCGEGLWRWDDFEEPNKDVDLGFRLYKHNLNPISLLCHAITARSVSERGDQELEK